MGNSIKLYYKESVTAVVLEKLIFLKISQNSKERPVPGAYRDAGVGPRTQDSEFGPWGGTLGWDSGMGPQGATLGWDPGVEPCGQTLG